MLPKTYYNHPIWDLEFQGLRRGKKVFYPDNGIKEAVYLGKVRSLIDLIPVAYNKDDNKYFNMLNKKFFESREEINEQFTQFENIISNILDLDEVKKIAETSNKETSNAIKDLLSL